MRKFIRCLETTRTKAICIAGMEGYIVSENKKTGKFRAVVYDLVGPCGPFDLSEDDFAFVSEEDFRVLRERFLP